MKFLLGFAAAFVLSFNVVGQGQVVFANRVGAAGLDAPVTVLGSSRGPGSAYTAQLLLVGTDGALTPLIPVSTFRDVAPGATGAALLADRYWLSQTVDVPGVQPGENATFVVHAWRTSAGSFDLDVARGESAPFTVAVGGNTLPPANLTTLQPFSVGVLPEPSVLALGIAGGVVLFFRRKARRTQG